MSKGQNAALPRDEAWYGSLFDQIPAGLFVADASGEIVECNRAFAESLGYASAADVKSLNSLLLFPNLGNWSALFEKLRQHQAISNDEWHMQTRQGSQLWLLVSLKLVHLPGDSEAALGSVLDITERKIEEEENQKHLRLTAAVADLGRQTLQRVPGVNLQELVVTQVAADLEVDYCQILEPDPASGAVFSVARAKWSGGCASLVNPSDGEAGSHGLVGAQDACLASTTSGASSRLQSPTDDPFASVMSVSIGSEQTPRGFLSVHSKKVRYFDDQEISFLQSVANVLAAALTQQETDQELRTSEERLRLAMDAAALGIWDRDLTSDCITWSKSQALLFGLPSEQLVGSYADFRALVHPDDLPNVERALERAKAEKRSYSHEYRICRHDGIRWIAGKGRFFYDASGRAYRAMGVTMDISERRRIEEQSRLRDRALEAVSQGIVITDYELPERPVIYVNQGFERLTGYSREEALGRNCRFLQGPLTDRETVLGIRKAIDSYSNHYCELLNYRKDGSTFWNAVSISPVRNEHGRVRYFLGVLVDVTDRRRLEEHYSQAQKMEAVGRFAGGVAHDFNNLLTVINGYGDMLLDMLPAQSEPHRLIDQIRQAGERGANLTRQILAFSKHKGSVPLVLDVNEVIVNMEAMLCRLIGEDLEFRTRLAANLQPVKLDPAQLDQIIVNLVINARDAMPGGGLLSISTKRAELSEDDVCGHLDAKPGCFAILSISDTGVGMDEATRARVFEPFFTTKGSRGTGLGLATVHRIVHQAGGFIEVLSAPGDGTSFQVYLPSINDLPTRAANPPLAPPQRRGNETVLLVEDEEGVRRLACHTLQQVGFHVLQAPNGPEALEISEQFAGPIHLLLSDVVMPRMSGRELAGRLKRARPGIKVLYMSGYVDDALVHHGVLNDEADFLQKPFDAAGLTAKVQEALQRHS
jgi:two-component system cell cycle sensor histidine kinase/response regulator CckA